MREGNVKSKRAGYSLLELLIVLCSIAILLSIAVPNFLSLMDSYRLIIAADGIASEMQYARWLAVSRNSRIVIRFDRDAKRYQLIEPGSGVVSPVKHLPEGIRFISLPRASISFHSRGNAVPGGSVVLGGNAGALKVIVNPGGRVRKEWLNP